MKNKAIITTILVFAIIVLANIISQDLFVRFDFSENKQYTLNEATKDILKDLKEPVTVKAYFSEDVPPDVAKAKKDFKELLVEYHSISSNLVYEFIDPGDNEELKQDAAKDGIYPMDLQVMEKDQVKVQKIFLGAVISMGEKKEVIPVIQPGSPIEYSISSAIKKLSVEEKPTIGLLQGNGEPAVDELVQVYNELSVLYTIEPLTLSDTAQIPDRIKTIAIIKPKDSISTNHIAQLDAFLARGGRLLLALNRVDANLQQGSGSVVNTGIESWLKTKGIQVNEDFAMDTRCSSVQVVQQQGGYQFVSSVQFPYLPIVSKFASHPATGGLESVLFPFASTIEYTGDSSFKYTPIVFTSEQSATENAPLMFNVQKQWTEQDFPKKNLVLAAAFDGKIKGVQTKIIVIGDGDFCVNGTQDKAQRLNPDNVNLFVNSIDWLSDDTGLVGLRTKGISSRPLDKVSDTERNFLKIFNFLLPLILVIGYGLFRFQVKRNQRIKRMEERYV